MVFTSPDKHIKNMPMCGTILMENNWKLAGDVGCLDAWGRAGATIVNIYSGGAENQHDLVPIPGQATS